MNGTYGIQAVRFGPYSEPKRSAENVLEAERLMDIGRTSRTRKSSLWMNLLLRLCAGFLPCVQPGPDRCVSQRTWKRSRS